MTPVLTVLGLWLGKLYSRAILIPMAILVVTLNSMGHGTFEYGNKNLNIIYVQSLLLCYSFAILFVNPLKTRYRINNKFIIGILLGWLSLFFIIYSITSVEKIHAIEDFKKSIEVALDNTNVIKKNSELVLKGTSALFAIKPDVTTEDWKNYINSLESNSIYDAIHGIGFMSLVKNENIHAFQKQRNIKVKSLPNSPDSKADDHIC
jgi:hypothetical protein